MKRWGRSRKNFSCRHRPNPRRLSRPRSPPGSRRGARSNRSRPLAVGCLEEKFMSEKIEKTEEEWKKTLTPEQYHVLREKGTQRAFSPFAREQTHTPHAHTHLT